MPAQPLLRPPPLVDEIVAVVDQQLQITKDLLVRARPAQVRLAQRRPCDRERVDRVRLAARPARPPLRHRQLRRHPHQLLTRRRAAAAPANASAAGSPRPPTTARSPSAAAQPSSSSLPTSTVRLVEQPAGLVDRDRSHRLLVYVHSDHDHQDRLLNRWGRPASGQTSIEAKATLLSGHARRSRYGGGDTTLDSQPSGDIRNRVSRRRPSLRQLTGRHHHVENDIEFGNVTRPGDR